MIKIYSYAEIVPQINLMALTNYMSENIKNVSTDTISIPEKNMIFVDDPRSIFISMPALSRNLGLYINKVGTFFERNSKSTIPTIHALLLVYSSVTGEVLAILDGPAVTNLKCAAITALVTNCCAKPDAKRFALIGAGVQARQQIYGVSQVRNIEELAIFNRSQDKLNNFINEVRRINPEITISQFDNIAACIENADIIATTTSSAVPIDEFANLSEGVHINCMGAHTVNSREIPHAVLNQTQLIVEDVPTAVMEAGEVHSNAYDVFNLHKMNLKHLQQTRTIFSSTGYAFLDLITASFILEQLSIARPSICQ